jgi:penicillin V acylase-like amidase (Ntn superfamily)
LAGSGFFIEKCDLLQFPGTFSSKDRFTRLALLNKLAPLAPQPAAVRSFMPPAAMNKPAVTAALLNVNSVTLPTAGVLEQGTQEVCCC